MSSRYAPGATGAPAYLNEEYMQYGPHLASHQMHYAAAAHPHHAAMQHAYGDQQSPQRLMYQSMSMRSPQPYYYSRQPQ